MVIRQSIIQTIADQSRVIRLPSNKIGMLNKIKKAQIALEQKLERNPSNAEIAEMLDIRESEIAIAQSSSSRHISTDAFLPGSDDITILEVTHNPDDKKPDDVLMISSLQIEIQRILTTLTNKERDVSINFYGIGTVGLSLSQIGEKYELTKERVRQIKEKVVLKMKRSLKSKNLESFLN